MGKTIWVFLGLLISVSIAAGCRGSGGDDPSGTDGDGTGDGDVDGDADADGDTNGFQSCNTTAVDLSAVATRVMLVQDRSGSMDEDNKWTQAIAAIETMVGDFDNQIEFGLDLFNISEREQDSCEVGIEVGVDAAFGNGQTILDTLADTGPGSATPLLLEMQNFLEASYAPAFSAAGANKYLVIVSDGQDTCGQEGVYDRNGGANAQELGDAAADLAGRGIGTIVVGFGDGADPDQLNAIAENGGTEFDTFIDADDGDALTAALSDIAETVAVSCVFELNNYDPELVDTNLVVVLFDDVPIPRDDDCAAGQGWSWVDSDRTTIQFCDAACAQIEAQTVESIEVALACAGGPPPPVI